MTDDQTDESERALVLPRVKRGGGRTKGIKDGQHILKKKGQIKILELAAKGMNQVDIAKVSGVSKQLVSKILKEFEPIFTELKNVDNYRLVRGDLLDAAELITLKSVVDPQKQADSSLNNAAFALRQLHDMRRLHTGLSTSNVAQQVSIKVSVLPSDFTE